MFLLIVGVQIIRHFYLEKERQIRIYVRETIEQKYPEQTNEMLSRYGIEAVDKNGFDDGKHSKIQDVILVHGLDEPGKVWMNLAPTLTRKGFNVWLMTYPNDQPIVDSAHFFLEEMVSLRAKGKKKVSIVAHSMGGLVSREMLTSPELAYLQRLEKSEVPMVVQLIMVGTPNHGSQMARFRIFTEFRDQLANVLNENYSWLHGILDGAGEAGLDLIPGSPFLETLNSRPYPKRVDMLVIAGVMSKLEKGDFESLVHKIKARLPIKMHGEVGEIGALLDSMAHGVGDGLVSVDSAKLEGVPLKIVKGTHLSIIRNIRRSSQRVPPAVPSIVKFLNKKGQK